jgi:hypothetical protein
MLNSVIKGLEIATYAVRQHITTLRTGKKANDHVINQYENVAEIGEQAYKLYRELPNDVIIEENLLYLIEKMYASKKSALREYVDTAINVIHQSAALFQYYKQSSSSSF